MWGECVSADCWTRDFTWDGQNCKEEGGLVFLPTYIFIFSPGWDPNMTLMSSLNYTSAAGFKCKGEDFDIDRYLARSFRGA